MNRLKTKTALYNRVKLLVSKENWIEFKESWDIDKKRELIES